MERSAIAVWEGTLKGGNGMLTTQSGVLSGHPYSFRSRFEDETGKAGTNPEELLGAAHAGCFTMQLSALLAKNGTPATRLQTKSEVKVQEASGGGFEIASSHLILHAIVPDISEADFQTFAQEAKNGCPVSKALSGIEISLTAELERD